MTTINLKDFYYWYIQDRFIEVADEVAGGSHRQQTPGGRLCGAGPVQQGILFPGL